jgi:hypothetical protein
MFFAHPARGIMRFPFFLFFQSDFTFQFENVFLIKLG